VAEARRLLVTAIRIVEAEEARPVVPGLRVVGGAGGAA
jgi:hypothetical protein